MPNQEDLSQTLSQVARAVREGSPPDLVAALVVQAGRRVFPAKAVGLWRVDQSREGLDLVAQQGFGDQTTADFRHVSLAATLFIRRMSASVQQVESVAPRAADAGSAWPRSEAEREGWGAAFGVTLVAGGELIGVLAVMTAERHRFTRAERALVQALGDLWTVAVARSTDIVAATEELRQANEQLVISNVANQQLAEDAAAAREEARQALCLRDEFMEAATHELRTPITVIKARAQILLRTAERESRVRGSLESIVHYADRLARLVDDLLAVRGFQSGGLALHREILDLTDLARDRVELVAQTAKRHQFRVEVGGPLVVDADRALLGEVFGRLLENALLYAPEGSVIVVTTFRQGDAAVVSVSYHGVGVAPERQPHVYEPLYEPVASGEPGYRGTASLGHFLSKQIVEAHGGHVWFTSTPSTVSTYSFSLPRISRGERDDGAVGRGSR